MKPLFVTLLVFCLWGVPCGYSAEHPLMQDFMGVNGHTVQFKPELYRPVASRVRDYHPVEWDLGKDSSSSPPFPFASNSVCWEKVYGSWKDRGWDIDACLMFETIPLNDWKNLDTDALAYARSFAGYFGPQGKFPSVNSVEIGNEPGKFNDGEYRRVFENMAKGIRQGDPKLQIATCNVTLGKSHAYAKSIQCLEGLETLYDILSVHVYAQLEPWPTWKRSYPEDAALPNYINEVTELCRWRDEHAPGKKIWITEFGYDASTKAPKPEGDFAKWEGNTDEEQALWIVRSWLLFSALPVDRAYLYFFNDDDTPQLHGSSGLTRNFVPKPSYWSASHLQKALGRFRFVRVVEEKPRHSMIYEYRKNGETIWVVWVPTREGKTDKIRLPPFPGTLQRAEKLSMEKRDPEPAPLADGNLQISGVPVFLYFNSVP